MVVSDETVQLRPKVTAVVTDVGSASSHASVIGRKYGIPLVVDCGNATTELSNGEPIEVDGSARFVRPLGQDMNALPAPPVTMCGSCPVGS